MFPVIDGAETIALREKDDFFLVLEIRRAFIKSYFAIDNQIQTLRIFLFLIDKRFLFELGQEHIATYMIDG
jgi:hypothetical protein